MLLVMSAMVDDEDRFQTAGRVLSVNDLLGPELVTIACEQGHCFSHWISLS